MRDCARRPGSGVIGHRQWHSWPCELLWLVSALLRAIQSLAEAGPLDSRGYDDCYESSSTPVSKYANAATVRAARDPK